jgi:hypothetical protein
MRPVLRDWHFWYRCGWIALWILLGVLHAWQGGWLMVTLSVFWVVWNVTVYLFDEAPFAS